MIAFLAAGSRMPLFHGGLYMSQTSDQKHYRAVICLFCGTHTPLPETRPSGDVRLAIIRCHQCGKEAPYSAGKIIDSQEIPSIGYLKIRAIGMG
jgi:hypothetical protein